MSYCGSAEAEDKRSILFLALLLQGQNNMKGVGNLIKYDAGLWNKTEIRLNVSVRKYVKRPSTQSFAISCENLAIGHWRDSSYKIISLLGCFKYHKRITNNKCY